jgi:hypothetical protein
MNITKRYVHPQEQTILDAMDKARAAKGGHNPRHSAENVATAQHVELAAIN